jgi:hypothetical protein
MLEDPALELLELRSRFKAQLTCEPSSTGLERVEGLRLAAGSIEREHQLCERTLAERLLMDEAFDLRNEIGRSSEHQVSFDSLLERSEALLLESLGFPGGDRLV